MRILVGVTQTRYGGVYVDVPEDSVILDDKASALKKKKAARQLATEKLESDPSVVEWYDYAENDKINVELGYSIWAEC